MATNTDRSTRRVSRVRHVVTGTAVAGSLALAAVLGLHVGTASAGNTGSTGTSTSTSPDTSSGTTKSPTGSSGLVSPGDDSSPPAATTAGS